MEAWTDALNGTQHYSIRNMQKKNRSLETGNAEGDIQTFAKTPETAKQELKLRESETILNVGNEMLTL